MILLIGNIYFIYCYFSEYIVLAPALPDVDMIEDNEEENTFHDANGNTILDEVVGLS